MLDTPPKKIGIGLIGLGRHGSRYARHILEDLPSATLVAACRRHPDQGLGLPTAEPVTMYGEAQALIRDADVDVVVVVTPPILTRELCRLAVKAGKPVLIEKPLATTAGDARAMVEEATRAAVPLMTGHTLRFDAAIEAMKSKHALIGRSHSLRLTSRIETRGRAPYHAAGYGQRGALLEFGVHLLDLVRFLTGQEVRQVSCETDGASPSRPDTQASVRLLTEDGTDCRLEVARVPDGRVGMAEWAGSGGRLTADWVRQRLNWSGADGREESWSLTPCQTVLATVRAFVEAVTHHRVMPITGDDGRRAVELADACYRSAELRGEPVALS